MPVWTAECDPIPSLSPAGRHLGGEPVAGSAVAVLCLYGRRSVTLSPSPLPPQGDIWAESHRWLGLLWRYYACMDGGV